MQAPSIKSLYSSHPLLTGFSLLPQAQLMLLCVCIQSTNPEIHEDSSLSALYTALMDQDQEMSDPWSAFITQEPDMFAETAFSISADGVAESSDRAALPMQAAASAIPNNEVAGGSWLSGIDLVEGLSLFDPGHIDFDLSAIAIEPMEATYSSDFAGGE